MVVRGKSFELAGTQAKSGSGPSFHTTTIILLLPQTGAFWPS